MEIIFFEKVLIKLLFTNTEVSEKTIPFLIPEIFEDHKNIQLIKKAIVRWPFLFHKNGLVCFFRTTR
jgi:hypothetical protein